MIAPILALTMMAQTKTPLRHISLYGPTADVLVKECRELVHIDRGETGDASKAQACISYIAGFFDGQSMAAGMSGVRYPVCVDSETTQSQLAKVVVKYGDDHPAILHEVAGDLINEALKDAYPCAK